MKRRVKKVYKKLPPHTNEAHHVASAGEASKPLIIGIITIVAVIILSLLLLFSDQFVGKAFFTGEANSAGAEQVPAKVYETQPFSLKVRANTVKEVSTIGFEMDLPAGVTCADVQDIKDLLGWEIISKKTCDSVENKVIFEYATLSAGKSGTFDVAQVDVKGITKGDYNFKFAYFQAFDSIEGKNVIVSVLDPAVQVVQQPVCSNGKIEGTEQCDDGNINDDDGCTVDCTVDTGNGWGCSGEPSVCKLKVEPVCGDGVAEAYEDCDGTDFKGSDNSCGGKGLGTGTITCTNSCKFDFSGCQKEQVCTPNQFVCEGSIAKKQCKSDGSGYNTIVVYCASGEVCSNGACVSQPQQQQVCTPSQYVCEGNNAKKQCKADGSGYSAPVSCAASETCSNGVCGTQPQQQELQCSNRPSGLVSWWTAEGSTVNDLLGKNLGTAKGGLSYVFGSGKVGNYAFKLDGVDDYYEIADDPSLTPPAMSLMAWIKWEGGNSIIASKYDGVLPQRSWSLILTSGQLKFTVEGYGTYAISTITTDTTLVTNQWYHVVAVYDSVNKLMKIYVNGVEVPGKINAQASFAPLKDDSSPVRIGAAVGSGGVAAQPFKGLIDEVAFWNRALTAAEVKAVYDADSAGMCKPVCGDGKIEIEFAEQCDDSNSAEEDGCNPECKIEEGWTCAGEPSVCKLKVQPVCGNAKLEAGEQCDDGNIVNGDGCSSTCQTEQQQLMTVTGTKITLTDADTVNAFATTITATESFTAEVTVYTVLYNQDGKVLSIKSEKIEGGLAKDQTYTAIVNYAKATVKKKSVLIFDKKQGPGVFGQLVKVY